MDQTGKNRDPYIPNKGLVLCHQIADKTPFMRAVSQYLACFLLLFCQNCRENPASTASLNAQLLPANAVAANVRITDLNCWVEQGQFFVTGVCSNESTAWQKIWLKGEPLDYAGKPLKIKDFASVVFPTFSSAVPPKGRTSFFAGWPLSDFSGTPDSCRITGAGAISVTAGPILLVEQISGVKMLAPAQAGEVATNEVAWQINAILNNPMPMPAAHPRLELLLFGTDNRLWLTTLLNPEDPQTKQMLSLEKEGPLQPGEQRKVGVYAFYERMPQSLKEKKIGRVEMLAFEER